ncbi:MAG: hypothetical protein JXM70_07730 [Pirellulales bacterium]|nr:hypothetical protein [Pirellulales bacterium]
MTELVVWLNTVANACAEYALAPLAFLPGWLSATLVAIVTGILMLLIFKYTSNQVSIKQVRNGIRANLLALSLFQDNISVSLRCQARVLVGACRLFLLAVVPMLVMTVPMCLLLAQMALWYQARPLHVDEEAVLTAFFADNSNEIPEVQLEAASGGEVKIGPVRVPSKHMVCWSVWAQEDGCHRLSLRIGKQTFEKEFTVGEGFARVSLRRPAWNWFDVLLHPRETPFSQDSIVRAIEIDYPSRHGWASGSGFWLIYWFVVSMVVAFCVRPWFNVNI